MPRLPGHGEQDRLSPALSAIGPDDLVDTGDLAVDIAAGLGEDVWVVGLSGGGTVAGWLASERDEVSTAVLTAPLVAPKATPLGLVVVTNENDDAVSNAAVYDVERQLEQLLTLDEPGVDRIDFVFADDLQYKHDVIDPEGENADQIDAIYPVLGPLLGLDDLTAP